MSQLLSLSQPLSIGHSSRDIVVAFSISVIIHLSLAFILWNVPIDRISVEPASPSIDNTLIVSLTTFPYSSHDNPDNKVETDTIVKDLTSGVHANKIPEDKSSATNTTSTFNTEALKRMEFNFGNIPEFKTETVDAIVNQKVSGSGPAGGNYLTQYLTPSYGLDAVNRFEQVFGEMSESELQRKKIEWRVDYIKNYEAFMPPDCGIAYADKGLLAIPFLIKDAITSNGCKW